MKTRFNYPTRIIFGQGVLADLADELKALGASRPLLVTDGGLAKTEIPERTMAVLRAGGLQPVLFSDISPNPVDGQVDAGAEVFKSHDADSLVALGGGSPMDAAKAIQIRINHHEPMEVYDDLLGGDAKITGALPPLVAIPTTAGTGSEVSRSAVITVAAADRKVVLFAPGLMPCVALCDPELTYGLPPRITAETGMDALSHSLEAYVSKGYHPMADAIALKSIRMIVEHLPTAVERGNDELARQEMLMASTMGAVAFQKGLGVVHSLAHPLSTVSDLGHGLANAILLPHSVRFNAEAIGDRIGALAHALGAKEMNGEGAASALDALLGRVGLPKTLTEVGVQKEDLERLVKKSLEDGCHACNPRVCTETEMDAILRAAF